MTRIEAARQLHAAAVGGRVQASAAMHRPLWLPALAVGALAFLVRFTYLKQVKSIPLFYNLAGDARAYDEWAQRIVAGDWLGTGVFYQAPLYPYFLGGLQTIVGHDLWVIRLAQMALSATSCALITVIGARLFSRPAGVAAGVLLAFYAPSVFFDGLIEKTVLDMFLSVILLALLLGRDRTGPVSTLIAGGTLGLLVLSRENALVLAPVIAGWIGLNSSEVAVQRRAVKASLFCAGMLLILVPVGVRNTVAGGEFTLTTSQFGPNFYIGNNAQADGTYDSIRAAIGSSQFEGADAHRLATHALGHALTPREVSRYWLGQATAYIKDQPGAWLTLLGYKWLLVWNAREIEDSDDFYIYQRWSALLTALAAVNHFGVLVPLAFVGVLLTASDWRRLSPLYFMIVTLAASVALFYVFGRYRYGLVPMLAPFAGTALVRLWNLAAQRQWRAFATVSSAGLILAVTVNLPLRGHQAAGPAGYNNLSNAYLKEGRFEEATRWALEAIKVDPRFGVAHYNLGNLYALQGRTDLAAQHLGEAVRLYPNFAEARNNYGRLLVERGDSEAGIAQLRRAVELKSEWDRAHLNLGIALAEQGRLQEAEGELQRASVLAPDSEEAPFHLGGVYLLQNRRVEAEEGFRRALQINSAFVPAHQSLAELLTLEGRTAEAAVHQREALRLISARGR